MTWKAEAAIYVLRKHDKKQRFYLTLRPNHWKATMNWISIYMAQITSENSLFYNLLLYKKRLYLNDGSNLLLNSDKNSVNVYFFGFDNKDNIKRILMQLTEVM